MAYKPLGACLAAVLLAQALWGQASTAAPQLKIVILEGEGAVNNIKQRQAREPVVQITDENDRPVGGALVTFALPGNGPGAIFSNGARTLTVTADSNGVASASGLSANATKGDFLINVSAAHEGQTATATIAQSNVGGGLSASTIAIIAGAVAAGTVVAIIVSQGDDSGGGVTTISPGGGTVVAPLGAAPAARSRGGFRISF